MEFVNAGLVGLAVFATVPVILHLFHRPKPQDRPFPSIMFLRRCARRSRAFASLRNLILMALRAAAVGLIALAVARPKLAGAASAGDEGVAAALVVDDGYRMSYRDGAVARFDEARSRALAVLSTLPSGSEAAVVLSSGEGTVLTPDLGSLRELLRRAAPAPVAAPILPALLEGARSLEASGARRREVHVFTDMARAAWTGEAKELRRALEGTTVYVHDAGRDGSANLAVTKVEVYPKSPRAGRPVEVVATVASWGRGGPVGVALRREGAAGEERTLTLPDEGSVLVRLRCTAEDAPTLHGSVALTSVDALAADDERHFAAAVGDPVRVLVVEAPIDAEQGTAPFVSLALAPPTLKERRAAEVAVCDAREMPRQELERLEGILVTDPLGLSVEDARRLAAWVQAGGGLAVFPSPAGEPERYRMLAEEGLLPRISGETDAPARLTPESSNHPIFGAFRAGRNGDLSAATMTRRLLLEPADRWRTALAFDDGRAAALECAWGRGRVLAFAFAPSARWTDLPRFPCFLPLIHETARHLAGASGVEADHPAGVPVVLPLPRALSELDYEFVDLRTGRSEERRADPGRPAIPLARALDPGRYAVRMAGDVRAFAVNLDPAGSDPSRLSREELAARLPGVEVSFAFQRAAPAVLKEAREGRELTVFALIAAVVALLIEVWTASRV